MGYCYEGSSYHAPTTKNMFNYGPIKVEGDNLYDVKIGGVASYFGGPTTNAINYEGGTITFDGTTRRYVHIGGAVEAVKDSTTDLYNYGDVTVNGKIGHTLYVGGCMCRAYNYSRTRNSNHGDVIVNAEITTNNFVGGMVYDSSANMRYTDCHNTGNLTLGEKAVVNVQTRWGGFVGKLEKDAAADAILTNIFDGCSNSGDIIIKGNASKTTYAAFGGIYGTATGNTKIIILNGFTNSGDIIFEGSQNGEFIDNTALAKRNFLDLGGLFGHVDSTIAFSNADNPSWTGDIVNKGTIKFTGTAKNAVRLGGFAGSKFGPTPTVTDGKIINLGDIVCTGTFNKSGDMAQYSGIGGILGYTNNTINNAAVFCNINAPETNAGMITGSQRSESVIATNCEVGGSIVSWYDGDQTWSEEKITGNNFYKYIYSAEIDEAVAATDLCSFISVAPTLPTTPPAAEETPAE